MDEEQTLNLQDQNHSLKSNLSFCCLITHVQAFEFLVGGGE